MEPATAMLIGGGISAGSNLLGGFLNNIWDDTDKINKENYNAQKEFAQNSIQWRVQDAEKAGIHPLYAMGNNPGYTPSSVSGSANMANAIARAGNSFGDAMGQIGMANAMLQNAKLNADIEKTNIDNNKELLRLFNSYLEKSHGQRSNMKHITGQQEVVGTYTPNSDGSSSRGAMPQEFQSDFTGIIGDLRNIANTMYNREANKLPYNSKEYDAYYPIGLTGYEQKVYKKGSYVPRNVKFFDAIGDGRFKDALKIQFDATKDVLQNFFDFMKGGK